MRGPTAGSRRTDGANLKNGSAKSAALRRGNSIRSNPSTADSDGSLVRSISVTTCGSEQSHLREWGQPVASQDDINSIFSSFEKSFEKHADADGLRSHSPPPSSRLNTHEQDELFELLEVLREAGLEDSALAAEACRGTEEEEEEEQEEEQVDQEEVPLIPHAIQPFKAIRNREPTSPHALLRDSDDVAETRSRTCSPGSRSCSPGSLGGSFAKGGSSSSNTGPGRSAFPAKAEKSAILLDSQGKLHFPSKAANVTTPSSTNAPLQAEASELKASEHPRSQPLEQKGARRSRHKSPSSARSASPSSASSASPAASPKISPSSARKVSPANRRQSPRASPRSSTKETPRSPRVVKAKQKATPQKDSSSGGQKDNSTGGAMFLRRSKSVDPDVKKALEPLPVDVQEPNTAPVGLGLPWRDRSRDSFDSKAFRRSHSAVPGSLRLMPLNEDSQLHQPPGEEFRGLGDVDVGQSSPSKLEQVQESLETQVPVQQQKKEIASSPLDQSFDSARASKASSSSGGKKRSALTRLVGLMRGSAGVTSSPASRRSSPERQAGTASTTFDSPEHAVILIDWDDTLLPTFFIKQVVLPGLPTIEKGGPVPSDSRFHADLVEHARIITDILRTACQVARVAIVTLATRWWVMTSAEWYLPGLDLEGLLVELGVEIWHADRTTNLVQTMAMAGHDPGIVAKKAVMTRILKRFYDDEDGCGNSEIQWNVLSIGDSIVEQEALKLCLSNCMSSGHCSASLCKTLKLRDSPSLSELSSDLRRIGPFLHEMVACDKDFERTPNSLSGKRWSF